MTNALIAVPLLAGALLMLTATPARADHMGAAPQRSIDLNVDLRLGADGFRLGGQLLGLEGVYGAWLNGQFGQGGFTLDGRFQEPERAFNFKLDADIAEKLLRIFSRDTL